MAAEDTAFLLHIRPESLLFTSTWKRWQASALRRAMRGRRRLVAQDREDTVDALCALLATTPLPAKSNAFSPLIYGAAQAHAELATRQFLYLRIGIYRISAPLFSTFSENSDGLIYPLPSYWAELLRQHNVVVRTVRSRALWATTVLALWARGVVAIAALMVGALGRQYSKNKLVGPFAHFEYIGDAQTPRPGPDGQSYDVMTWYRGWNGRNPDVKMLTYRTRDQGVVPMDPAVKPMPLPFGTNMLPTNLFRFFGWGLLASGLALLDILRGRWWHALMLHEAAQAKFCALVEPESLAKEYLFNNSGWFQRPLWTYQAEQRGARILFYHYSTNSAQFKTDQGYRPEHHAWSLSNWPLHLVWDEHNARFVQNAVGLPTSTEIVGPIWFSSSPEEPPHRHGPSIAVFDVTPFRPSKAPALALPRNYYTASTCIAFINDIVRASSDAGLNVLWKRKRNIGKAAHPAYRAMANDIDENGMVEIVLADHSPIRVILAADAVISMPFTSTAHLARQLGKPSCYYDPTGTVQKDDRAAHDIPVLRGYRELELWLKAVRSKKTTNG